ncbi:hypothetical protein CVT25_011968 [Psilocybe cyanescens]|uniref:Uncharacterized protein n=1 Tax=Psilocybe cyanescens TaxID=93625 RepID=A0A409XUY1_PSICY|nr:hypothetical protein CVT25_011968 [Psilocybe cyanescens]
MIILTPSNEQLDHIPTISYLTLFLLFFSALKFLLSGKDIIEEGYRKPVQYPGSVWNLPMLDEWLVVANRCQQVEDICKASENQLLGVHSNPVFYQWDHTLSNAVSDNPYHINIGPCNDIHDKMILTLNDMIPCKADSMLTIFLALPTATYPRFAE